ncbi:MAG: hypothetical protein NUW23_02425 [Firmicutes bacterium]|jgi:hypothetical protein|nr:hypothetical protein [Bacillota bacterium]
MGVGIVLMPQVLREKLGDDGAEALVGILNKAEYVQKSDLDDLANKIEKRVIEESSKIRSFVIAVNGAAIGLVTLVVTILQVWAR